MTPARLTDEQMKTLLAVARSVPLRYRCWFLRVVVAELGPDESIGAAVSRALARLQQREAAA